jgi:hypothetical protein
MNSINLMCLELWKCTIVSKPVNITQYRQGMYAEYTQREK